MTVIRTVHRTMLFSLCFFKYVILSSVILPVFILLSVIMLNVILINIIFLCVSLLCVISADCHSSEYELKWHIVFLQISPSVQYHCARCHTDKSHSVIILNIILISIISYVAVCCMSFQFLLRRMTMCRNDTVQRHIGKWYLWEWRKA